MAASMARMLASVIFSAGVSMVLLAPKPQPRSRCGAWRLGCVALSREAVSSCFDGLNGLGNDVLGGHRPPAAG